MRYPVVQVMAEVKPFEKLAGYTPEVLRVERKRTVTLSAGTYLGLVQILAHFSLLMLGAKALTQRIIERVWGSNPIVRKNLGGS